LAQEAPTLEDLNAAIAPAVRRLGFQHFAAFDVLGGAGERRIKILNGSAHPGWLQRYDACSFAGRDAAMAEIAVSTEPFWRSELASRRSDLAAVDHDILVQARACGVHDSLFFPQHRAGGALGAVVFTATAEVDHTTCRRAAPLVAQQYGLLTRRLLARRPASSCPVRLSRRQLECLTWVRNGKTSSEIGRILNLSGRTVDAYVAGACERFGVRTRVQAVARALLEGLLPG
jgi:DNA-binding CsgD family transcriptional regulator